VYVTALDVSVILGQPVNASITEAAETADAILVEYLDADKADYASAPRPVTEAGAQMAVNILQNRTSAGGQSVGLDGSPAPYRMGQALIAQYVGLLEPWLDMRSELQ